jgi:hypothetical protein
VGAGTDEAETAPILPWGLDQLQTARTGLCFRLVDSVFEVLAAGGAGGIAGQEAENEDPDEEEND